MKIIILSFLLFFLSNVNAQSVKTRIDEHSIVKDSTGFQYPYAVWIKLMQSGKYSLKPANPANLSLGYIIKELTNEELQSMMDKAPKPTESKFFTTGKKMSEFRLANLDGVKYKLGDLKGKIIVINFWFINCPPCQKEIPDLNKLVNDYKEKDVVFLAPALDGRDELVSFLRETKFEYQIIDESRWFAQKLGVTSFPTHLIIDKEGMIRYHSTGLSLGTVTWIRKTLEQLLAE